MKFQLDKYDRIILDILQKDCTRSIGDIADRVGLSNTACWRRIHKMEEDGIIRAKVALLDRKKLNINVIVIVFIKTAQHSVEWIKNFHDHINSIDEVIEVYRMAGETDYLLKVAVSDVAEYDKVYKKLIQISGLADVSSSFAMEQIKYSTELPLNFF
ncbi:MULTISPECIES: Lrp/AsnC family transcriptional regulator [Acinetobacter]|uniref:Transcriptional regulator n=1 Tax=Acinetobacter populi TaxID=1582270 RepID=A0A1Z9YUL8_9GAMM|nr:Lrp/AsnC family transcriptional regulator [Acinetobacter populi]MCH4248050.1 Lrp/AsnC family transcriptional regulator [Acinetobacter populi]OUY05897.1 transcriptional regulator [Acinetobacter populi]